MSIDYAVPTGWRLVPVEPTAEMLDAIWHSLRDYPEPEHSHGIYRAMLDDAPTAPVQAQGEPVAWVRNLTDPQPHCVTGLQYRTAADADAGVQYIPVFLHPPRPDAEIERLRAALERLIIEADDADEARIYMLLSTFIREIAQRALRGEKA